LDHQKGTTPQQPLQVVCALIEQDGQVLCAQRSPIMRHPGLWEFPGGKIQPNEEPIAALKREIFEELGVSIAVTATLPAHIHTYPGMPAVQLWPFRCLMVAGHLIAKEHAQLLWVAPQNLMELEWLAADRPIVQDYLAVIGQAHG